MKVADNHREISTDNASSSADNNHMSKENASDADNDREVGVGNAANYREMSKLNTSDADNDPEVVGGYGSNVL